MSMENSFDPIRSLKLISHDSILNELINLYEKKLLPNILMVSGKKGIGKFTLINHFLNYIFNKNTETKYDLKNKIINERSLFYNAILNHTSQNVLYLNSSNAKRLKIDDIRNLKNILSKKLLNFEKRFIIIDEIEFLNVNSSNALLKILEEPSQNNFFILINNNQFKVLETISSRCIKYNIFLSPSCTKKVIKHYIDTRKLKTIIDIENFNLTPGIYLEFNNILLQNQISLKGELMETISILLLSYKKSKNILVINLCNFLIEEYFYRMIFLNKKDIDSSNILKDKIIKTLKDFEELNLNVNSVINSIKLKLEYVK